MTCINLATGISCMAKPEPLRQGGKVDIFVGLSAILSPLSLPSSARSLAVSLSPGPSPSDHHMTPSPVPAFQPPPRPNNRTTLPPPPLSGRSFGRAAARAASSRPKPAPRRGLLVQRLTSAFEGFGV